MTVDEIIAGLDLTEEQIAQLTRNLAAIDSSRLEGLAADVARAETGSIMTRAGLDLLAKGIIGKQIKFTRIALGDSFLDGELVEITDAEILELTALIHHTQDIPLTACQFNGNGTVSIQGYLQNANLQSGFWLREIGLFAEDPDTHQEILYSYKNSGLLSSYTPSGKGAVITNDIINLVTVVDNASNITAVLDTGLIYVSQAQMVEHINSTAPHPNTPLLKDELNAAPVIWSSNADNHLHPLTIENLTAQILSDDAEPISRLSNRIAQVETNVANIAMQIDSADTNLLLAEDFKALDAVDLVKVKVLNTVGGPSDVYTESLDGILVGHYYTISDGVRNQFLRVQSLNTNGGLCNVMFDSAVLSTFNLSNTYLYRTTAVVDNGRAAGSNVVNQSAFSLDYVWQGASASVVQTLTLNTTQSSLFNFELSGAYSFNSDGFFTLA